MSKKKNQPKCDFVNLIFNAAQHDSNSKDAAKDFLASEGVNTEKLVSDGLKRIKQMQMMANANRTEQEMQKAETVKAKATQWVDDLLGNINFSLQDLVKKEELSMSFRNVESLSQDDIRNILIKHFTLKFMKAPDNNAK